jgi:hypothetical protein
MDIRICRCVSKPTPPVTTRDGTVRRVTVTNSYHHLSGFCDKEFASLLRRPSARSGRLSHVAFGRIAKVESLPSDRYLEILIVYRQELTPPLPHPTG